MKTRIPLTPEAKAQWLAECREADRTLEIPEGYDSYQQYRTEINRRQRESYKSRVKKKKADSRLASENGVDQKTNNSIIRSVN